jgi:hypothetical protein
MCFEHQTRETVITLAKKLQLEDLERAKSKKEAKTEEQDLEDLYDLIIPPGTPSYIIYDIVEEFDLEPVGRKLSVHIVETDEREVIVLRGILEEVQAAERYLRDELQAWIDSD